MLTLRSRREEGSTAMARGEGGRGASAAIAGEGEMMRDDINNIVQ